MATIGDLQSFALPDLLRNLRQRSAVRAAIGLVQHWGVPHLAESRICVRSNRPPGRRCAQSALSGLDESIQSPVPPALTPLYNTSVRALGDWIKQQNWLTEEERSLVFQAQLKAGLYPLFELASGQFYFVGDMVPLPYWEMTGLEIPAMDAITQGLNLEADTVNDSANLPLLDRRFLSLTSTTSTALRLSLLDRRLLQWFRQPNTIQSLCQVLNVKPIELQKACKRLLQLQLIEAVVSDLSPVSQSSSLFHT